MCEAQKQLPSPDALPCHIRARQWNYMCVQQPILLAEGFDWVAGESAREAEERDLADVTWAGAPKTALPQCRGDKQVPRPAG